MNRHFRISTILLACMFLFVAFRAADASTDEPALPDLPSAAMSIPWSDFKELLRQIQPPTVPPEEKPPLDWTIASAEYDAEALGNGAVRVRATMQIVVWKPKGWVKIPIVGDSVAPISATLDGKETSLAPDNAGWFTLLLDTPGKHTFETSFFVACAGEEGVRSFRFPCSRTPLTHMRLQLPLRDAQVNSPAAANVSIQKKANALTADIAFRPTDVLAVDWTLAASLQKPKPVEEARATCSTSTLASVTERFITCESRLHYDILRGGFDTFRVQLPRGVSVLEVSGQGAEWTRSESEAGQVIEVKTNHTVQDKYDLALKYEVPFGTDTATVKVPEVVVADVVRETGYIGVTARGNVEVNESPAIAGLLRVDVSELPESVRALSPNPILLGFKYTEHPYLLAADVRKLDDMPVRVAAIDRAEITTVVTDEGIAATRARYYVRNNLKQFLRVEVPQGAEVWGAEVAGQVVKPARDNESNTVLVPLLKSAETNQRLGAFPVEVVYMMRMQHTPRLAGRLALYAPATDILANEVQWEVLVPESQRVYRSRGDLKPLRPARLREEAPSPRPLAEFKSTVSGMAQLERADRQKDAEIARGIVPASAPVRVEDRRSPKEKAENVPTEDAVKGVLPVRIELPAEGIAHHFKRIIVPQAKPLELRLYTYNSRVRPVLAIAGILIGVGLGYMTWLRFVTGRSTSKALAVAVPLLAILITIAVASLPRLWLVYAGVAAGLVLVLLMPGLKVRVASNHVAQ